MWGVEDCLAVPPDFGCRNSRISESADPWANENPSWYPLPIPANTISEDYWGIRNVSSMNFPVASHLPKSPPGHNFLGRQSANPKPKSANRTTPKSSKNSKSSPKKKGPHSLLSAISRHLPSSPAQRRRRYRAIPSNLAPATSWWTYKCSIHRGHLQGVFCPLAHPLHVFLLVKDSCQRYELPDVRQQTISHVCRSICTTTYQENSLDQLKTKLQLRQCTFLRRMPF